MIRSKSLVRTINLHLVANKIRPAYFYDSREKPVDLESEFKEAGIIEINLDAEGVSHCLYYHKDNEALAQVYLKARLEAHTKDKNTSAETMVALGYLLGYTHPCSNFETLKNAVSYHFCSMKGEERLRTTPIQLWGEKLTVEQTKDPAPYHQRALQIKNALHLIHPECEVSYQLFV